MRLLPVVVLLACNNGKNEFYAPIEKMISEKNYFGAEEAFRLHEQQLSPMQRLKITAALDNAFNQLAASNEKIGSLFAQYSEALSDSAKYQLLHLKQMNHAKLYEYQQADTTIGEILARYRTLLDKDDQEDFENTRIIWRALSGQPKQTVEIDHDVEIKMKRDKAGLQNLTVTADTSRSDFIFDTGANLSTTTETTAQKFRMHIMEGSVQVHAITGITVPAKIALCPELNIHGIRVKNAAFLVFPDSALAIPQIDFQINGIIGFPVIEAMKEMQITKDGTLIIPEKRTKYAQRNMALDFLTPILHLGEEYYTFDTGADGTILYRKYFIKHRQHIEATHKETDLRFGGAGGHIVKKGYQVPFTVTVEGREITIDSVQVLKEGLNDDKNDYYGNIGQDLIKRFRKMTLNFEDMFIKFD